jgi:hypothetical protein
MWHMARVQGVTTRLDVLKVATNQVLTAMQADNLGDVNNLSVGIYTFNAGLLPIYPGLNCTPKAFGCEAGSDFTTAIADVGAPPTPKSGIYTDTGIQPAVSAMANANNDDTAVQESMSYLAANYVTAAGDGSSATKPRKVLFLITDGVEDDPYTGVRDAMPSSMCQTFKNMGYTVYVAYTTYYPVMHQFYLANMISWAEGTGSGSIAANLQACSSATDANNLSTYYIEAENTAQLTAALNSFLTTALQASVRYTE